MKQTVLTNPSFEKKVPIEFAKKPMFISKLKCQHPADLSLDTMKLCIRHPIFLKIEFGNFISQPGARRILTRNLKYLRGTRYCHFTRSPSFYAWKLAYDIEDKAFQERFFFGDSMIPLSPPSCSAKDWAKCLENLAKSHIRTKVLQIGLNILGDLPKRKRDIRQLQSFHKLKLQQEEEEEGNEENVSLENLCNIGFFVNLQILSLELGNPYTAKALHNAFETLGNLTKLTSLTAKFSLSIAENNEEPKAFADKFVKLEYLHLQITLPTEITDTGNTFVSFGQFSSVNYLNFELFTGSKVNHLDAIKFVVAHKHLETLKFQTQYMEHSEYIELFEGIKKMEFLAKLCVLQRNRFFSAFEYSMVFETIEALKNLKSFKLYLGYHAFGPDDMRGAFKSFLEHPSLQKVDILMRLNPYKKGYQFCDEFYGNLEKLKHKLTRFKLFLILFDQIPVRVSEQIEKVLLPKGIANKHFSFKSLYL